MPHQPDPIRRFRRLLERAAAAGEPERGTAMTLATASAAGAPSARMVLLKGVDERGFVFYTNFASRKAVELDANPLAALVFYWPKIKRQVRVEGRVARVTDAEADAYFATRPRQSEPLGGRRELVRRYLAAKARFLGRAVPRPPFWGGYRLAPERIEVWRARLGRLHDRILYLRRPDGGWTRSLLYP